MLTRRHFLSALAGGALTLAGCRGKSGGTGETPIILPVTTVISPQTAAAAPLLTQYPLRFTDVSEAAGLHWAYRNGATGKHHMIETTGGGVAFFDYNNDGLLDIFAVQSGPDPKAGPTERNFPNTSVLYRNNGDGTFTDVTAGSGLDKYLGYGQGVTVADYDNDGWPDLYVTAYGGNHLLRNNRNGTFTDVTAQAGLADLAAELPWPLSAAWGDYDNDGHLDLFVCHYARWSLALDKPYEGPDGKMAYDRPQVYDPSHDRLYHNNGDGTFTDVSEKAGIRKLEGKSMSAVWLDYDEDGWMDLFVTNDTMPNFLLHNNRNGTFTDKAIVAGVGLDDQGPGGFGHGAGRGGLCQ